MADTESSVDDETGLPEIVHTEGVLGGDPRIEGRRIGVIHVYRSHVQADESPEEIAEDSDISLAEVHAALVYAVDNRDEIDAFEQRDRRFAEQTTAVRLRPEDIE